MAEFVLSGQELFGRYARIAYGHALDGKQDYHIYKCIQSFMSNCYCDVPLTYQTENNCYKHDNIVEVVNVIHCGIDENKVIRVARNDIELIPAADAMEVVRRRDCKHAVTAMAEYIDKSVLYEKIAQLEEPARNRYLDTPINSPFYSRIITQLNERTFFKQFIADFPAADVEPVKRGRWKRYRKHLGECSECGEIVLVRSNYCPNCGAKMDEEAQQ